MNRDDYLEEEWPEESLAEPETPAEEEESDRGLYTYDTAPSEEKEDKNAKASPDEADFQNAEHFTFRLIDDHRIYKMEEPPKIESKTKYGTKRRRPASKSILRAMISTIFKVFCTISNLP